MNSTIDDLILLSYLNSGCFAETFISKKKGSNQLYATKRIPLKIISQEPFLKKYLENEIIILNKIKHPNIVKLYDVKVKKDYLYLVMEYCNGGSLSEALNNYKLINGKPFTEKLVQFLMKQIISAVECLHKQGVIHRDLKLENILLKYNSMAEARTKNIYLSQVKLIDFNISARKETYKANPEGDEAIYMDPNFFYNDFDDIIYDEKIDIWSLGMLCYEMLTGIKPYKIGNQNKPIKDTNFVIPKTISLLAQSFLSCMLEKDRNLRWGASDLKHHDFMLKNYSDFPIDNTNKKTGNRTIYMNKTKGIFPQNQNDFKTLNAPLSKSIEKSPKNNSKYNKIINISLTKSLEKSPKNNYRYARSQFQTINSSLPKEKKISPKNSPKYDRSQYKTVNSSLQIYQKSQKIVPDFAEINNQTFDTLSSRYQKLPKNFRLYNAPYLKTINSVKEMIQKPPKKIFEYKYRNTVQPKYGMQTLQITHQPIFKKYTIGSNINANHLNIIINCCKRAFITLKGGKNLAKKAAEDIKKMIGDNWLVMISVINKSGKFDFNISPAKKGDFAVFSLDNRLFQICRY